MFQKRLRGLQEACEEREEDLEMLKKIKRKRKRTLRLAVVYQRLPIINIII